MNETVQFRFADNDGNSLVDFLGENFWIHQPWSTRGPEAGERTIRETLNLLRISDADGIMRDVTTLEDVLSDAAKLVQDEFSAGWYWFHWVNKSEEEKRALLFGGNVHLPSKEKAIGPRLLSDSLYPALLFDRHRAFENVEADSYTVEEANLLGTQIEISAAGTLDGRVAQLILDGAFQYDQDDPVRRIWAGFRKPYGGTDAFEPVIDAITNLLGPTTSVADTAAHGGSAIQCNFSSVNTEEVAARVTLATVTVSDFHHFAGQYLVLLRWSGTLNSEFAVRMGLFYDITSDFRVFSEKHYVTGQGTSVYDLLPIGLARIPLIGLNPNWASDAIENQEFEFRAEIVSGSASDRFRIDTITLIPVGHDLVATDVADDIDNTLVELNCLPNDRFTGWSEISVGAGIPKSLFDVRAPNFYAPREGGVLVVAAAQGSVHDIDDTADLTVNIYPRWKTFRRGSEAHW